MGDRRIGWQILDAAVGRLGCDHSGEYGRQTGLIDRNAVSSRFEVKGEARSRGR
jgi:hypothetical protein